MVSPSDISSCPPNDLGCNTYSQGPGISTPTSAAGDQTLRSNDISSFKNFSPGLTPSGENETESINGDGRHTVSDLPPGMDNGKTTAIPTPANGIGSPAEAQKSPDGRGNSGVSSGAVAGIAIATAIIGAALAFLAAFLLFKKRNSSQNANGRSAKYETYEDSTPKLVMAPKNNDTGRRDSSYAQVSQAAVPLGQISARPIQQAYPTDPLAGLLPPVADEHEIQAKVVALFGEMHRHVEAYYRNVHASITSSLESELARFGTKDVDMAELLQDCSSPIVALKHALVAYTLGITGPRNGGDIETLFPKELEGVQVHGTVSDPNHDIASTLHRRLSVYLYGIASSRHSQSRNSWALSSDIREAAEYFSLTFFPWANPMENDQDRDEGLAHIISSALELRIWLFGQPSVYDFSWEGSGRRGIVISPALVRQADERVILEMGVVSA